MYTSISPWIVEQKAKLIKIASTSVGFNVLIIFLSSKMELDEFYDSKVDLEKASDEKYGYFIVNFNFDSQKYLKENKKVLEQEYENLKHLIVEHK